MQNLNLVERIRTYIIENGNTIKNYVMLCEVLDEKTTSGEAKQNQLNRWKTYFDYKKTGHKFEIVRIYDDETIEENERVYFNNTEVTKLFSRSPYRKDLAAILIYVLKTSRKRNYLTNRINLAIRCGLLDENIKGKSKHKEYIDFRNSIIETGLHKRYFSIRMYKHFYCLYSRTLKNSVYRIIESALDALQEMKLIKFKTIYAGIKNGKLIPLTISEIVKNEQLEEQILNEIYPKYVKMASRPKEKIKIQDLMYYPRLLEEFYDIKEEQINEQMNYSSISEYYDIYLADDFNHPGTIEVIENKDDFEKVSKRLNKTYVDRVLNRENKKIKEAKIRSQEVVYEYLIEKEKLETWYYQKTIAYYNKIELLDQFVNCNEPIDAIIIDDEYTGIIDMDVSKSAYEIFKEFNIQSKKFQEDEAAINEELFDEIAKDELIDE